MGKLAAILVSTPALVLSGIGMAGCGSSDSSDTTPSGAGGGTVGIGSPGVAIAHEVNVLIKETYDLRCRVCPCGGFNFSSPAGEACTGALLDLYAGAKRQAVCKTEDLRAYATCLQNVTDCTAADACTNAMKSADTACPSFDEGSATQPLPPACTNVM